MNLSLFLAETFWIDYHDPGIHTCVADLFSAAMDDTDKARAAYLFVQDKILHTFDIGKDIVPVTALLAFFLQPFCDRQKFQRDFVFSG